MDLIGTITKAIKKDKVKTPEDLRGTRIYDYSDEDKRVVTVEWLFEQAKTQRNQRELTWQKMDDYYQGRHDVVKEMEESIDTMDVPFAPPTVPDPYIMVESQITPDVPMPEFHGRDDDLDSFKAEMRQKAVKFVCDNNRINDMNTANERRLRKYGDAWWKAWWDADMPCGQDFGDIRLKDIPIQDIYVDPTADRLEDAEYVDYVYTLHKNKFWRIYHKVLEKKGVSLDDICDRQYRKDLNLLTNYQKSSIVLDDLVQVIEHWFKQPYDGNGYESGDIACSIQAGGIELNYIPCYWERTHVQNKLFPFVHYWCIGDETGFYNKSEIEPIISMVDSADRELATGIMNDAMMANDVILLEQGVLVDGEEISNIPGSVWHIKQGKIGSVARLGGLSSGVKSADMVMWLQNQIQRTNRNYDTNNGQEAKTVTTASGLLQLRSDAAVQGELKKADRNKGFCRLYELIDWLCLEFYTDDRMLYLGIDDKTKEPEQMKYNSALFAVTKEPLTIDMMTGEIIIPEDAYYPRVDVTVTTGDGIAKNPASTVQVLDRLAAVQVTSDNWELLAAELDYLDIPQKQSIVEGWKNKYGTGVPEEIITALQNSPELVQAVGQLVQQSGIQTQTPSGQQNQLGVNAIVDDGMNIPTY